MSFDCTNGTRFIPNNLIQICVNHTSESKANPEE